MIKVGIVNDKKIWENFVLGQEPNIFLQSWNWGEFHQSLGEKIFRIGFWDKNKLVGTALLIKEEAKRGTFLSCPGGPLIDWNKEQSFRRFVRTVQDLGEEEKAVFIRVRPSILSNPQNMTLFRENGFISAPMHMHAETTWQLDIKPSEEKLLSGMRKTTRYCIKKAIKDGVKIEQSQDTKKIDILYKLQLETARRHQFVPFSEEFLRKQFQIFSKDSQAVLFLAKYRGQILAVSMIIFYGDTAVYHYSGSTLDFPKISASHLIQWEAIMEAKKRNCAVYNFWGIAPDNNPRHRFAGVTTFKKGFGGYRVDYLHAQDLSLGRFYWLTRGFETIRRIRRRL